MGCPDEGRTTRLARMRAIHITETGGPDVLHVTDIERPSPGAGELLIEVAAAGVNFIDTYQRGGLYPMELPFTPGLECAGTVVEVGDGVDGFAITCLLYTSPSPRDS